MYIYIYRERERTCDDKALLIEFFNDVCFAALGLVLELPVQCLTLLEVLARERESSRKRERRN
jgi:hypothetical protein